MEIEDIVILLNIHNNLNNKIIPNIQIKIK